MEIQDLDYLVLFDKKKKTVYMKGMLRLANFRKYDKIKALLLKTVDMVDKELTLDLTELIYLNSSGITTISTFVIYLRRENSVKLSILGNKKYPWQERALKNLQKLWDDVNLQI